ncbi:MAG TPA: TlpA disulfide reductase family protein [Candidatus Nanopelagicales bacterium]|nr:TlpA disulfide reductase family protein [Candidatus Nanopelagicales bacterium]
MNRQSRSARVVATFGALVVVLAACTGQSASNDSAELEPSKAPSAQPTTEKDPGLLPLIAEAGLDPCPPGDPNPDAAIPGLPPLTLRCLGHGPDVDLSQLRGKPLVVNVWASWCPPCIAEMPILAAAASELRGQVQFLGVDIQDQDASALAMMRDFDADFPSVVDEPGVIRGELAISGPPVTFFVNEQGVITGRHDGALPSTEYFNALLSEYLGVDR